MRHTKGHRNQRRAHHALKTVATVSCKKCHAAVLPHHMCMNCGTYAGREVVDVLAKLTKKERKLKEKELSEQEGAKKGEKVVAKKE